MCSAHVTEMHHVHFVLKCLGFKVELEHKCTTCHKDKQLFRRLKVMKVTYLILEYTIFVFFTG